MKYLLPCEKCGEKTPIDVNQAGQQIACGCGEMLEIPSLRAIRQLARSEETVETVPQRAWSVGRGIVFATGLVITLAALAAIAIAVLRITLTEIPEPPAYASQQNSAEIDAMSPAEAWDEWQQIRREGLGVYRPPVHVLVRQSIENHKTFVAVASIVAACAMALSAGACLFPSAKRRR